MENGAPTAIVVRSATCNVLARVNRYSLDTLPLRQPFFYFVLTVNHSCSFSSERELPIGKLRGRESISIHNSYIDWSKMLGSWRDIPISDRTNTVNCILNVCRVRSKFGYLLVVCQQNFQSRQIIDTCVTCQPSVELPRRCK